MTPALATLGSIVALITSILAALGTFLKVMADRRQGIGQVELDQSKFGLEALQAAITVKDAMIAEYKADLDKAKAEIARLDARVDELEKQLKQ